MLLSLALCAVPLFADNAFAAPANDACVPTLKDGWVRMPPMANAPMAAGFGTIENACATPAEIVAVQSPAFASVSLHQSMVMDGMAMMHELQSLPVAAGKSVVLQSGSYHLMLMRPAHRLVDGEKIAIVFKLKDGREAPAELQVGKSAPANAAQAPMGDMHGH